MTHPIFVVGPQRAGSRIASHIIARDTNRQFIDELEYNLDIPLNSVIQAPFLLKSVIELSFVFPTARFGFMYRNKADIIKSMKRIEWYKDYTENDSFYSKFVDHAYHYIDILKQDLPKDRWFDIHYDSLRYDPLFVTDRTNFTTKQHQPNEPNGPKTWRNDEYARSA